MNNFKKSLLKKLKQSQYNNFGVDNYDESRYGELPYLNELYPGIFIKAKRVVKKIIGYNRRSNLNLHKEFLKRYEEGLQRIYEKINKKGQKLLVEIIAYRLLGNKNVKLSRNNKKYRNAVEIGNSLVDTKDIYDPHFLHFILQKCDLRKIGYDIQLYFFGSGIAVDFILE
jgi:hypothetical protein